MRVAKAHGSPVQRMLALFRDSLVFTAEPQTSLKSRTASRRLCAFASCEYCLNLGQIRAYQTIAFKNASEV
jgi:hypothetical protein